MKTEIPRTFLAPATMTFNDGVILAANAIADLCLVLDGLECLLFKAERVFLNHDARPTLLSIPNPRLFHSLSALSELALGDTSGLAQVLEHAADRPDFKALLISASSKVVLTDPNYDSLLAKVAGRFPCFTLKQGDFQRDWLQGYAAVCETLAQSLPLREPPRSRDPNAVALVGYLMDRNEADHTANLAHLKALLASLGLDCRSVWLSGGGVDELSDVVEASTILALPYASQAAKILAERLDCDLLEVPLPVGFEGTRKFLRVIGERFDRAEKAALLADEGETRALDAIKNIVPLMIEGRSYSMLGDPHLTPALVCCLRELGAYAQNVALLTAGDVVWDHSHAPVEGQILLDPDITSINALFNLDGPPPDFAVMPTPSLPRKLRQAFPIIPFGVPAYFHHCLTPSPFMGYEGVAGLVERIRNGIAWHTYLFAET